MRNASRTEWVMIFVAAIGGCAALTASGQAPPATTPPAQPPPEQAAKAETPPATEAPTPAEAAKPAEADKAAPKKPKYLNLRYDEDFSYLDGPAGSYTPDFFDPIKNIHLGDNMRLSIGGEFRFRLEAETNKNFDRAVITQDTFQLYRYLLHFDLKYEDWGRVFAQFIVAHEEDRNLPDRPVDENRNDIHQLFFDVKPFGGGSNMTVRVGRQELSYGKERLISPLEWANVRRRFDAVKVFWKGEQWDTDVFYAKPAFANGARMDHYEEDYDLYGLYVTYKGIPRHGVDFYFFGVDDTRARVTPRGPIRLNPNGKGGDVTRLTLGSRFWGKTGNWDYEAELSGQWGNWAGDTIQAWSWLVDTGYTLAECPWKPRIAAGFDWASGDEHPRDGKVGTFDQLFPLGHAYFGYIDLIGRQNVNAVNVNLTASPIPDKVKTGIWYHTFWLNAERDAMYDAGGAVVRRDPTGHSGSEIGHEVDMTVNWQIDTHSSMLFGWSHFWDSTFIIRTRPSEDADLFYVQYAFKF
ncbi:MAG: alginate export family protein [Phycisphaerales bacterium]|nr:alginate export family protein [Phycisphaerales bacterium]